MARSRASSGLRAVVQFQTQPRLAAPLCMLRPPIKPRVLAHIRIARVSGSEKAEAPLAHSASRHCSP